MRFLSSSDAMRAQAVKPTTAGAAPSSSDRASDEAAAWYDEATPADAHADSLLWNRDLCARSPKGHADFPRLREAGIRAQAMTIPTWGLPGVDGIGLLGWWTGWPRAARRSPRARAMYQIEQLRSAVERSGGGARLVGTRAELDTALEERSLAIVAGIEGAQCLEGDPSKLAEFAALGVRFIGPSHLMPNEFASCSFWMYRDRGLTGLGRELIAEAARLHVGVDTAHASPRSYDAILASGHPACFNSHTGVRGAAPLWRNLSDEQLRAAAAARGVVSLILATQYLGGKTLAHFAAHARHAANVIGADRLAIGSDFDGFIGLPREMRDARGFRLIAPALARAGFNRRETLGILGGNLIEFWRRMLPER